VWLRADERKLSTNADNLLHQKSTLLDPIPSMLSPDARPMPRGKFVELVIPLYYEGHVYRAGPRIRVTKRSMSASDRTPTPARC